MGDPVKESIQARGRGEAPGTADVLMLLSQVGQLLPNWWSRSRDIALRSFWKKVDTLAGAEYVMQSKISTIPLHVEARDKTIASHVKQADQFTTSLLDGSEFGKGWGAFIEPSIEDLTTQDNGMFAEVIGEGEPDGPIIGMPLTIAHLDSARCQRTNDPEFPVIYTDEDSKRYKLHYSRVIEIAQMPSSNVSMRGVGLCAVSRCVNIAQNFYDILVYKQEKLGSAPKRALGITKGGLTPGHITSALALANEDAKNKNLSRYSQIALIGASDLPDAGIDIIDLSSLPDGFNEQESTTLTMAAIALAFGMDARELWPAMSSGATKAEALVQHLKQRGKGPGHILESITRALNQKYLPPHLQAIFDFQDDEQDKEVADIKLVRWNGWKVALDAKVINLRTVREMAFSAGDLEKAQFIKQELEDGRLEDGDSVLTLFYDPDYKDLLSVGVDHPMDVEANDPAVILASIADGKNTIMELQATSTNYRDKQRADNAMAALNELEKLYKKPSSMGEQMANSPTGAVEAIANPDNPNAPNQQNPPKNGQAPQKVGLTPNIPQDMNVQNQTNISKVAKEIWHKVVG
jgi:hypothetical protein